jgi:hypothetical protein
MQDGRAVHVFQSTQHLIDDISDLFIRNRDARLQYLVQVLVVQWSNDVDFIEVVFIGILYINNRKSLQRDRSTYGLKGKHVN